MRWHDSGEPFQLEQARRLPLGHPGPEAGEHAAHTRRRLAGGPLERRQLLDLVDDPEPVGGVDQQVGRVLHQAAGPVARRSSSTRNAGASIVARLAYVFQPTTPDPAARSDALVAEDLGSGCDASRGWPGRLRSWNRTGRIGSGADLGQAVALVAEEDRRIAASAPTISTASSNRGSNPVR